MDRRTFTSTILLALGLIGSGAIAHADGPAKGSPTLPASTAATLTRQLTEAVGRGDAPGVVALVVNRDGVIYEGTAGKLDVGKNVPMPRTRSSTSPR